MPSPKELRVNVRRRTRQSVSEAKHIERESAVDPTQQLDQEFSKVMDSSQASTPITELTSGDNLKIDLILKEVQKISHLFKEINELKRLNQEKDEKIAKLEDRLDSLEQYSRIDNIIISGFKPTYSSYSRAATYNDAPEKHELAPEKEKVNLESQVINYLNEKGVDISSNDISACHTLPGRGKKGEKPIVICLTSRKAKIRALQSARNSKPLSETDVYVNEHLTSKNGAISKRARELKKQRKIEKTWIRNCKIFIAVNINGESKVHCINSMDELNRFNII